MDDKDRPLTFRADGSTEPTVLTFQSAFVGTIEDAEPRPPHAEPGFAALVGALSHRLQWRDGPVTVNDPVVAYSALVAPFYTIAAESAQWMDFRMPESGWVPLAEVLTTMGNVCAFEAVEAFKAQQRQAWERDSQTARAIKLAILGPGDER